MRPLGGCRGWGRRGGLGGRLCPHTGMGGLSVQARVLGVSLSSLSPLELWWLCATVNTELFPAPRTNPPDPPWSFIAAPREPNCSRCQSADRDTYSPPRPPAIIPTALVSANLWRVTGRVFSFAGSCLQSTPPAHIAPRHMQRAVGFGKGSREMVGSSGRRPAVLGRSVWGLCPSLEAGRPLQLLVEEFGVLVACPVGCPRAELPAEFCQRKGWFGVWSGVMLRVRPLPLHRAASRV